MASVQSVHGKLLVSGLLLFSYVLAAFGQIVPVVPYPEDANLDMVEILTKYGYPSETHYVTTPDGYILKVYRITGSEKCKEGTKGKRPVILMHGLMSNSIDFIVPGPEKALGYLLADDCYDVWTPNSRGNFESRNHTYLNPDIDQQFWRFSWHEMGKYDVPTVINFVLESTGADKVNYIGHSQGTTQFFVYASLYPEESANKVESMQALAPPVFMNHATSPFLHLGGESLRATQPVADDATTGELLRRNKVASMAASTACFIEYPDLANACALVEYLAGGFDSEEFNATLYQIVAAHDPAGSSFDAALHYLQGAKSGEFLQFDFDNDFPGKNMEVYGQSTPPRYEIENIAMPVYLHYGLNDWFVAPVDVERLAAALKKSTMFQVKFEKFNHMDFLFAIRVKEFVNDKVLEVMKEHCHM